MVIIISTISLGVVVPTLKEMNIMRTTIGQFILLVAVLADLFTMVLLTIYGGINGATTTMTKEKNSISSPYVRYDINVVASPK